MATFTNQATLTYNGQSLNSNVTTGELTTGITLTKTAVSSEYARGSRVVYTVTVVNNGAVATGVTLTDDLGAYAFGEGELTPLTYVESSLLYYVNGVLTSGVSATGGPPLTFTGINLPAGGNVQLIYEAQTNEYAPLASGSTVTNTATLSGGGIAEPLTDSATLSAEDGASLSIAKAISPATVADNGTLTYTFVIQNYGNTATEVSDGVVVSDTFNPILNPISVTVNGVAWTEGTEYTYDATTGEFATAAGSLTVPGATYAQDAASGAYSVTPGVTVITVSGTV